MKREEIMEVYLFLRKNNSSIPSETLEFIKDAALSMFDSINGDFCKKCLHNGKQQCYPSPCTWCGSDGEGRHFTFKTGEL